MHQRAELHQRDVVMVPDRLLFPRPDTRAVRVTQREPQVETQQAPHFFRRRAAGREIAKACERAKRRPVILRPRPALHVDRPVRVETRLGEEGVAREPTDLGIGTQEFAVIGLRGGAMHALGQKRRSVEPGEAEAEMDEIREVAIPVLAHDGADRVLHQTGDGAHHDRGVA